MDVQKVNPKLFIELRYHERVDKVITNKFLIDIVKH
jgi:hypothetical protein